MIRLNGAIHNEVKQAKVKYDEIIEGKFPEEVIVTMSAFKGKLTAIFPSSSIDKATGSINAFVIAKEGDLYLVDLPTYTLTSGSKAWFPKELVSL